MVLNEQVIVTGNEGGNISFSLVFPLWNFRAERVHIGSGILVVAASRLPLMKITSGPGFRVEGFSLLGDINYDLENSSEPTFSFCSSGAHELFKTHGFSFFTPGLFSNTPFENF